MITDVRAGFSRARVDTRASATRQGSAYSRKGVIGDGVVSAVSSIPAPAPVAWVRTVCPVADHCSDDRQMSIRATRGEYRVRHSAIAGFRPAWRTYAIHRTVCTECTIGSSTVE